MAGELRRLENWRGGVEEHRNDLDAALDLLERATTFADLAQYYGRKAAREWLADYSRAKGEG